MAKGSRPNNPSIVPLRKASTKCLTIQARVGKILARKGIDDLSRQILAKVRDDTMEIDLLIAQAIGLLGTKVNKKVGK